MKQVLQSLKSGRTTLIEAPVPRAGRSSIVVESRTSIISAGTERMLVEFGRAGLLEKARQQPDKVRDVINKVRTDGLATTLDAVRAKLEAPVPLGYCSAGIVVDTGADVSAFRIGDRVVTNGNHAEFVSVPSTLAAKVPDGVSDESAAMVPLAAIGLQGLRLANPTLGETVVVYGLGLIGLLTVQLVRAAGCRVIGIDGSAERCAIAREFGADVIQATSDDAVVAHVLEVTSGVGADAVLLTLAADSDAPMHNAALMSRKRGRIVLVGVTGLSLRREDFYKKELSFQVSCSYGPGRYDPQHEDQGIDYPLPFVRWTEARNFDAVLGLMADGRLTVDRLISHRFPVDDAAGAYELLASGVPSLAIAINYSVKTEAERSRTIQYRSAAAAAGAPSAAFIGAGNFASRTLMPLFKDAGASLDTVVSSGGTSAAVAASKHGFRQASSDAEVAIGTKSANILVVATRHDSHARYALRGLQAGKNVFVEKPLALTHEDIDRLADATAASRTILTVGFNRRYAPHVVQMCAQLANQSGPKAINITVNAGAIPADHWTRDLVSGGGRIAGEGCHFIDLARHIAGAKVEQLQVVTARSHAPHADEITIISLGFVDGGIATIQYLANGSKSYPKERVEVFRGGAVWRIDNFRKLEAWGGAGSASRFGGKQDKGHAALVAAFVAAVRSGGPPPIPHDELFEVSRLSVDAARLSMNGGGAIDYRSSL